MSDRLIPVPLPDQPYNIAVGTGALDRLGALLTGSETPAKLGRKALLVSNPTIFRHYGDRALRSLQQAGFETRHLILPAGERYKTPATVLKIHDAALEMRLERRSLMVALGGGVIGDMTGFAAATWLRGIHVAQVPTTLLAMVDAAIGGKTGVNHPRGKNLIGAFHQPRLVLIDPEVLSTLPVREFRSGMAEVIKYGVIWSRELFEALDAAPRLDRQRGLDPALLTRILDESARAKAEVVSQDEKEGGLRAILNYGHTIGHAIESLTNYKLITHGEGVAIGMVAAGRIAVALGMWSAAECDRQDALIARCGLPTRIPAGVEVEAIIDALGLDKKVQAGKVRFILPESIGRVVITDQVPNDVIRNVLGGLLSEG